MSNQTVSNQGLSNQDVPNQKQICEAPDCSPPEIDVAALLKTKTSFICILIICLYLDCENDFLSIAPLSSILCYLSLLFAKHAKHNGVLPAEKRITTSTPAREVTDPEYFYGCPGVYPQPHSYQVVL